MKKFLVVLLLYSMPTAFAQAPISRFGRIEGRVVDRDTQRPLIGANILLVNTTLGAIADGEGRFAIEHVPVGNYSARFSFIGYEKMIETDVIIRSERITFLAAELKSSSIEMPATTVRSDYFAETEDQPLSIINYSREEIRRAPGSAGDVSRILMTLPSIAKVNDQSNALIVRGGSPTENAFYVDNIEIPNINHWPTQGASGGPIGLLNVDFIRDVRFSSGGFNALYGDRLSSVMDLSFREGNREEFDGQLDLNFAGFGFILEDHLPGRKGSWLVSARRSYLDMLIRTIDMGTSLAPSYGDAQAKVVIDLHPRHQLSFIAISGDDHNNPTRKQAVENDMIFYGDEDIYENTGGLTWRALWPKGYSLTSLSLTSTRFRQDFDETGSADPLLKNHSQEFDLKWRQVNHFRLNAGHTLEFGIEGKRLGARFDNFYADYTDALGAPLPGLMLKRSLHEYKIGAFINYTTHPLRPLTMALGLRADHFTFNGKTTWSPRLSIAWQLSLRSCLTAASGLYHQNLPVLLLAQNEANAKLADPLAVHWVLGWDYLLTENTKLTVEAYLKEYRQFPIDPNQPRLFLLDELYYRYGFFFNHSALIDRGRATAKGVEITVQKKLAQKVYGLASAAYFTSRYRDLEGVWRQRVFDNRIILSLEGGYKPDNRWEFSGRWIYAGGAPYTPFAAGASQNLNRGVLDEQKINAVRFPDYHSLNIRFDRRFHFSGSNLVFYFSVWNAYDRKNVAGYFWNQIKNQQGTIYQWNLLPIFGLEYEF